MNTGNSDTTKSFLNPENASGLTAIPDAPVRNVPGGTLAYRVFLHPDARASEQLVHAPIRRKFAESLQRLAIDGTNVRGKSLVGHNQKWKRVGLSGTNGSHFYLYYTTGNQVADFASLGTGDQRQAIFVRAIRHHDDHSLLEPGSVIDYQELCATDLAISLEDKPEASGCGLLLTRQQRDFATGSEPIRVGRGRPGAGKTVSLLATLLTRAQERVLYLTFSERLVQQVARQFDVLGNADTELVAMDFTTLLQGLLTQERGRLRMVDARRTFNEAATRIHSQAKYGGWRDNLGLAFNEIRANIVGRLLYSAEASFDEAFAASTSTKRQGRNRADREGLRALASDALSSNEEHLERIFGDLRATWAARDTVSAWGEEVPEEWRFDRIMVDEVQDMTQLEWGLIIDLCAAIAKSRSGRLPYLCIVGDEGQTVRPTAFDFGQLNGELGRRFGKTNVASNASLCTNIRSPKAIAEVVDRIDDLYLEVTKAARPAGNARDYAENTTIAHVFHALEEGEGVEEFLTRFFELPDPCVIALHNSNARLRVKNELRERIMTPDEVKGLEFQNVCVLDAGQFVQDEVYASATNAQLGTARMRQAIDALRVAVSRAVGSLVLLDLSPSPKAQQLSRSVLGCDGTSSLQDIVETLGGGESTIDARISDQLRLAEGQMEDNPARALGALERAKALFLQFDHAEPVEVGRHYIELASRFVWRSALDQPVLSDDHARRLRSLLHFDWWAVAADLQTCLNEAITWNSVQSDVCASRRLLQLVSALDNAPAWVGATLKLREQHFLKVVDAATSNPEYLGWFLFPDVEGVFKVLGSSNPGHRARGLRKQAWQTAAQAGDRDLAMSLMKLAADDTAANQASVHESVSDFRQAASQYEVAGEAEKQARCLRMLGQSGEALSILREKAPNDTTIGLIEAFRRMEDQLKSDAFVSLLMPPEKSALVRAVHRMVGQVPVSESPHQNSRPLQSGPTITGLLALHKELELAREGLAEERSALQAAQSAFERERSQHELLMGKQQDAVEKQKADLTRIETTLTRKQQNLESHEAELDRRETDYLTLQEEVVQLERRRAELIKQNDEARRHAESSIADAHRAEEAAAQRLAAVHAAIAEAESVLAERTARPSAPATEKQKPAPGVAPALRRLADSLGDRSPLNDEDRHRILCAAGSDHVLPSPKERQAFAHTLAAYIHCVQETGQSAVPLSVLGSHVNARKLGFSHLSALVRVFPRLLRLDTDAGMVVARF